MPGLVSHPASSFFTLPFRRHKRVYEMNPPDETYNVTYLGNVLTVMGKGEASIQKPLNVIWRTYNSKKMRRDISMKLFITRSGLKADTKQGTTEYWANRVTYCAAPTEYPRVFCWVYKHEGKRMKPDLRCHAVLCRRASEPSQISTKLNSCLQAALLEYKREKLMIEKARKNSLSGGIGPRRKIMLQTGSLNFRTPMCRSKSAPRLGSIDEEDENDKLLEEDEEELDIECMSYHNMPIFNDSESASECSTVRRKNNDTIKLELDSSSVSGSSSIDSASSAGTSASSSFNAAHARGPCTKNVPPSIYVAIDSFDECSIDRSPLVIRSQSALIYTDFSMSCPTTSCMELAGRLIPDVPTINAALGNGLDSISRIDELARKIGSLGLNGRKGEPSDDVNQEDKRFGYQITSRNIAVLDLKKLRLNRQNSLDDSHVSSNSTTSDTDFKK